MLRSRSAWHGEYLKQHTVQLLFLAEQTAQQTVALSHCAEDILVHLEYFTQFARLACQFGHVLDVTRIVLHIFHELQQLGPGEFFALARHIGNRAVHTIETRRTPLRNWAVTWVRSFSWLRRASCVLFNCSCKDIT